MKRLDLVAQYCQRLEIKEVHYYHFNRGIPKGCSFSPLMAAVYLKPLDDELKQHGFYVRFMDDWLVLVKTKQQLRQVIRLTHKVLTQLKLTMHPDKTFLGRIKKVFDFLGIHFSDTPKISKTSQENHRVKLARRYAQGARVACIGAYKARWTSWCRSVLNSCTGKDVIKQAKGRLALKLVDDLAQLKEKTMNNQKWAGLNKSVLASVAVAISVAAIPTSLNAMNDMSRTGQGPAHHVAGDHHVTAPVGHYDPGKCPSGRTCDRQQ